MPFCIRFQTKAGLMNGAVLPNTGHHILQAAALRCVIEHIIRRDERNPHGPGETDKLFHSPFIIARVKAVQPKPYLTRKTRRQIAKRSVKYFPRCQRWHGDKALPVPIGRNIVEREIALTFWGTAIAQREQSAEPRIGRTVLRVSNHFKPILSDQSHTRQEPQPLILCRFMRTDNACKCITICNTNSRQPKLHRLHRQLIPVRRASQKTKIAGDGQFRKEGHSTSPPPSS